MMLIIDQITELSSGTIEELHRTLLKALLEEDRLPAEQRTKGVREHPDWRQESDALEKELASRGISFTRIPW
jgi:hypothetical protein